MGWACQRRAGHTYSDLFADRPGYSVTPRIGIAKAHQHGFRYHDRDCTPERVRLPRGRQPAVVIITILPLPPVSDAGPGTPVAGRTALELLTSRA